MTIWFTIIFLLVFLFLILRRPKWGGLVLLILLPSYLVRFEVFNIPTTFLEVAIYLWALVTIINLVKAKEFKSAGKKVYRKLKPFLIPLILFCLAAMVSVFVSDDLLKAAGAFKAWVFDALLFFVLFIYYYHSEDYKKIIYALIGTLWLVSLWSLVELIGDFGMQIPGFANAMYQSANMVALIMVPIWLIVFGFTVGQRLSGKKYKDLTYFIITLLISGLVIYLTKSYAGLLALIGGICLLILFMPKSFKKIKQMALAGFILLAFLAGVGLLSQGKLQRFFDDSTYDSFDTRQQIWYVASELLRENIVLGIGFDSFEKNYYDKAFEIYNPPLEWEVPKSHNLYLNTWLEMGILGIIALIWLIVEFLNQAIRKLKNILEKENVDAKNYFNILGISIAFISILIHGLLDTPYFKNDLSVLWWFIIGILLMFNQKQGKES